MHFATQFATFKNLFAELRVTADNTGWCECRKVVIHCTLHSRLWPCLKVVCEAEINSTTEADSRLDITSNLLLTFPFFLPSASCLLIYSNLRTPCSQRIFHLNISLHALSPTPTLLLSLSVCALYLFIYFRNNFLANYSKMATAVIRG